MVEIVVGIYIISFVLSLGLVAWNYTAVSKELKSNSLATVNFNLEKIGLFWSMSREDFSARADPLDIERDAKASLRSTLLLGLLAFGSFIGFFLLLSITLVMRLLKSNRKGRAVFQSELSKNKELSADQVQAFHSEFSQIH